MSRPQALRRAEKLADRTGETAYLVYESGEWDACSLFDLETFYAGATVAEAIPPRR